MAPTAALALLSAFLALASAQSPGETLIFSDDFDELDFSRWRHELTASGGGNWEFEYYTNNRSNSYAQGGYLHIVPTMTSDAVGDISAAGASLDLWGADPASLCTSNDFFGCSRTTSGANYINPIQSARLRTAETFGFKYGRLEVRAKLPKGDWLWPAIWLLPLEEAYGRWPASGEIDVMESRGNDASYPAGGVDTFGSTLHFGPNYQFDAWSSAHATRGLQSGDFSDDFHVFGLFWNESTLYTYLDSDTPENRVLTVNGSMWQRGDQAQGWSKLGLANPWQYSVNETAPFDRMFYIIINLAVGGVSGYFPDGMGDKPWKDGSGTANQDFWNARAAWGATWGADAQLLVDSVKVWALPSSEYKVGGVHVRGGQVVWPQLPPGVQLPGCSAH